MKKLLGILLTAVMVCTSMGVLATGETTEVGNSTTVWTWGFEQTEGDVKASDDAQSNLVFAPSQSSNQKGTNRVVNQATDPKVLSAHSGEQYMYLNGTSGTRYWSTSEGKTVALEEKTLYRFSFYYAITNGTATPYLSLNGGGTKFISERGFIGFSQGTKSTAGTPADTTQGIEAVPGTAKWNYYEVYFMTADTLDTTNYLTLSFYAQKDGHEYYDDLKLEKINGRTAISFKTGTGAKNNTDSILSKNWKMIPQEGWAVSGASDSKVLLYPLCSSGPHATVTNSPLYVNITHAPRAIKETITVIVGWYDMVNGQEVLKGIKMKPITFEAKTKTDAEGKTEYYFGDNMMNTNAVDTLYISGVKNYHIKAFAVSNLTNLEPLAPMATLPAAQ